MCGTGLDRSATSVDVEKARAGNMGIAEFGDGIAAVSGEEGAGVDDGNVGFAEIALQPLC